jgi:hypothetical protein
MPLVQLVQGWTGRLDFQLLADAAGIQLSTSDTVQPWLFDRNCDEVATSSGDITVITASCGVVGYSPKTTGTLLGGLSDYTLRFRVKDTNDDYVFFPNEDPITLQIRSV